jgi:hypothetical protein
MQRLEPLVAGLGQDADQVHHRVGTLDRGGDGALVAEIRIQEADLADIAHCREIRGPARVSPDDGDDGAAGRQTLHDVPPDEARASEYRHSAKYGHA